jgi:hypothetical protein
LPNEGYITFNEVTKKATFPDTDLLVFAVMSSSGGQAATAASSIAFAAACILDAAHEKR